jgi:hypothetical protein
LTSVPTDASSGWTDGSFGYRLEDPGPIVDVAVHAYSSLLGLTSVACGLTWPADPPVPASSAELRATLDAMQARVADLLVALPAAMLEIEMTLPWGQRIRALDAIADGLAHGFEHVGHLGGIRAIGGFPTPSEEP